MTQTLREYRIIESPAGRHLFVVDGSRLFGLGALSDDFDDHRLAEVLEKVLSGKRVAIDGLPLVPPPLQTLSLNLAQACNMSCDYCYADEGAFGARARLMSLEVAHASVDRLLQDADGSRDVVIGFMGGEPLLNREVLHRVAPYARERAERRGVRVRFSITTNATLLQASDVQLFAEHQFQVAVSIDGDRARNNASRRLRSGASAYDCIMRSMHLFEQWGRPRHLSARMTISAGARDLSNQLEHVFALGFDSAGFAPVLSSPRRDLELAGPDFGILLEEMKECGRRAETALLQQRRYPFSNYEIALQQIERGTHRPYACGAGAAYLSVNADGELFACHRFVNDTDHHFGNVRSGSDFAARARYLAQTHVDRQQPCSGCWARYLCGGGCQHEVQRRGRPGCDYIRGWLDFCLSSYCVVRERAGGYFENAETWFQGATLGEDLT